MKRNGFHSSNYNFLILSLQFEVVVPRYFRNKTMDSVRWSNQALNHHQVELIYGFRLENLSLGREISSLEGKKT